MGAVTPRASSQASVTVAGPTVYKTVPAPTTPSVPSYTPTATRTPDASSSAQLRQISLEDHTLVSTQGSDRWVPQLSSKRPGVVDQGVVWDNELTLEEHLRLRQEYGAKLLWSGDWSTFDAPNFWVTIAPITWLLREADQQDARGGRQHCVQLTCDEKRGLIESWLSTTCLGKSVRTFDGFTWQLIPIDAREPRGRRFTHSEIGATAG